MRLLRYFLKMNLLYYIIYKSDTCTLHVFRIFSELVTSDIVVHRVDEKEIVTGSQSFMKLIFLLLWQLYWFRFTRVLCNYIYLNWNKALFRYFKIFNFSPSEIGNIALMFENRNCRAYVHVWINIHCKWDTQQALCVIDYIAAGVQQVMAYIGLYWWT
jgi:hypothetical protein